jgi:hypothetical protein
MEAIGAGAGILAFVTLGIKSAKVIHDILSSYRDSNKNVEQTTNNVASLQASLERFSRCRHVCERPDEALATKVKQCADDTSRFADDLKRLSVNNGATMERKWQKIKAFFKEKDLAKFSTVIVGHTAALNFYLDILDRYVHSILTNVRRQCRLTCTYLAATPSVKSRTSSGRSAVITVQHTKPSHRVMQP